MAGEIFQHQAYEYGRQIVDPAERAFFEEVFRRCACANTTGACVFSEPQEAEGVRYMTASIQGPYGSNYTLWTDIGAGARLIVTSDVPIEKPHVARGYQHTDEVVLLFKLSSILEALPVEGDITVTKAAPHHRPFVEGLEQRLLN